MKPIMYLLQRYFRDYAVVVAEAKKAFFPLAIVSVESGA